MHDRPSQGGPRLGFSMPVNTHNMHEPLICEYYICFQNFSLDFWSVYTHSCKMKGFSSILLLAIMLFAGAFNRVSALNFGHKETKAADIPSVSGVSAVSGVSGVSGVSAVSGKTAKAHPKLMMQGLQHIADTMQKLSDEMAAVRQEIQGKAAEYKTSKN